MEIIPIESGPVFTIGYLVNDSTSNEALIIDIPYGSADRFIQLLSSKNSRLIAIIITHTHWDHTADVSKLYEQVNAPVYLFKDDEYRLLEPNKYSVFPLPFELESYAQSRYVNHNHIIKCGSLEIEVRHTPGHTEGGICLVEHNHRVVFTGVSVG